jgi:hypothetical protein
MWRKILIGFIVVLVDFVAKAVHLFMNMDRMIGGQFEIGLAQLKAIAEAAARK